MSHSTRRHSEDRDGQRPARGTYLTRLLYLLSVAARRVLRGGLAALGRRVPGVGRLVSPETPAPRRFRELLEDLGGSFIKFGQVLSLQPDLLSREHCDELFDLLDRVPPFALEDVERIFLEDFGKTPVDVFDSFETAPFASASIGQVHRARLDGHELAVKIRRPTALRDFGGDIRLMQMAVRLITTLRLRRLEAFRMPINEFIAWTRDELDYRTEARYMQQVRRNTEDRPEARVPAVLPELSSSRILTAELLSGVTLLEYLRALERQDPAIPYDLEQIGFDPHVFAENILTNFLGDVFRHGVFHADLHPANLLILPDNAVGYVDFGITGVISSYGREEVLALILALARHDVDDLHRGILRISEITDRSDVETFRRRLRRLADSWFERRGGSARFKSSYTLIMLDLIRLSKDCSLLPHEEALRYMRSVITADGLIARFAPDFDVNETLERLSAKHLGERALETLVSADRLIEASISSASLMRDGALRLDRLLDRLERAAGRRAPKRRGRQSHRDVYARRSLRLAALVVVLSVLLATQAGPLAALTLLATAQLALGAAATLLLAWNALRWIGGGE